MILHGRAWRLGDHVSTDEILPGRYMALSDPTELGRHALEGVAPALAAEISAGDILVAGENFGTGSSRQQAPLALRSAGFAAAVASSFARIFFRNCINMGFPVLCSAQVSAGLRAGDEVEIDTEGGVVRNLSSGAEFRIQPLPDFVQAIVAAGGLAPYARLRLGRSLVPPPGETGP